MSLFFAEAKPESVDPKRQLDFGGLDPATKAAAEKTDSFKEAVSYY